MNSRQSISSFGHQEMQVGVKIHSQEGQKPRVREENIRRCSVWQSGQRIRANPQQGLLQSR
jgi:hypothetical protein